MHARTGCPYSFLSCPPKASQRHRACCPSFEHSELSSDSQAVRMYTVLRCGAASHLQCMPYRVYEGIEAPEMAKEQLSAGYYYPNPMHDIWSFGLLLFFVLKGMGQLPHEHQTALQNGTTLLFANKLCDQGKYKTWRHKVTSVARPDGMNACLIYQAYVKLGVVPSYLRNGNPLCCSCAGGAHCAAGRAGPSLDQSCAWLPGKGPKAEVHSSKSGCIPDTVHPQEGVVNKQHSWPSVRSLSGISMRSHW